MVYLFVIITAGMLFEWRGTLLSVSICSLAVLGMILAENADRLHQLIHIIPLVNWITYMGLFGVIGLVSLWGQQTTKQALGRAEQEIKARQLVEMELRKLAQAVEQSPASILITDLDGNIEYVNPRFTQVTGYSSYEVIGKNPRILKTNLTAPETHAQLWQTIKQGKEWQGEFVNRKKDGTLYYESAIISPIADLYGIVTHYLAVKEDITARKLVEAELHAAKSALEVVNQQIEQAYACEQQLVRTDALTALNNLRYFNELAGHAFEVARRYHQPLSLIMFDIDKFKNVNDTLGHSVGDQVLIQTAQVVSSQLRAADIFGRIGGDEFVIILPGTNAQQAFPMAERIRAEVALRMLETAKQPVTVTISMGIAGIAENSNDDDLETLMHQADLALYAAKAAGRNETVIYKLEME